jgi:hypothetical protein
LNIFTPFSGVDIFNLFYFILLLTTWDFTRKCVSEQEQWLNEFIQKACIKIAKVLKLSLKWKSKKFTNNNKKNYAKVSQIIYYHSHGEHEHNIN